MKISPVACLLLAALGAGAQTPRHQDGNKSVSVVFFDDFSGANLDRSKWSVRITGKDMSVVNTEQQAYIDSSATIYIAHGAEAEGAENGALVLQPRFLAGRKTPDGKAFDFISGRIDTRSKFEFQYGRASARIKMTEGHGLWPAWWILGKGRWPDCGEIDVMENVGDGLWASVAMHGPGYSGNTPLVKRYYYPKENDITHWHIYAVDWTPDSLVFKYDDTVIYTVTKPMVTHYGPWAYDNAKYLILNFAVGGGYPAGVFGTKEPFYGLDASTVESIRQGKCKMLVDWVKVVQHSPMPFTGSLAQTAAPRDGTGAYATGKYPNLFKELGHSDKEVKARIDAAFHQLFHGDTATQAVYFDAGKNENGPLAYISDVPHHDIRSEGMSYGMMITVQLNKRAEFDALWNYAMTYMYVSAPEHPSEGYFSWSLKRDGTPNEETPAPDGEEYFVMALYFASNRWGDGKGIYNYHQWADKILTTMRHHPLKSGQTKFGPRTIATMVNDTAKMIRFVPGVERGGFTDPSYHLPAFYELWARWGPAEDRSFWADAADTSRAFFQRTTNPETGLAPNLANFDGTPLKFGRSNRSSFFGFDSWRTASNWSFDWVWWQKDRGERVLSDRIQAFFASQGMSSYGDQYMLDGKVVESRHANGLVATNAVAGLAAANNARRRDFAEALWNAPIPHELVERYYDGLLYIMSLLHCSGNYRIWGPHH